jgi:hypothetical protein
MSKSAEFAQSKEKLVKRKNMLSINPNPIKIFIMTGFTLKMKSVKFENN